MSACFDSVCIILWLFAKSCSCIINNINVQNVKVAVLMYVISTVTQSKKVVDL